MENKSLEPKKDKKIREDDRLINPNVPISEQELKKLKRKHLIIEITLGVLTALVVTAMILILVLVKK